MSRALIVEDDPTVCGTLQNALARLGYRVTVVTTAEAAIEELKESSFDAVFAELCARERGGRSVARWLKSQCADTKVFIITSWKGELEPSFLLRDGIHDVIRKPLVFNEIRGAVLEHPG